MCNVKVLYILTKNNLQKKKQGAEWNKCYDLFKKVEERCMCVYVCGGVVFAYIYIQARNP